MKSMGGRPAGERLERVRASPRFSDGVFRNLHPIAAGLRDPSVPMPSLGQFLCPAASERRVPRAPLPSVNPLEIWRRAPGSGLRATWLGHSTVLIEIGGVRVLTDPVWGPRASPTRLAGPRRFQPVPVALRALPPLDAVLVSHDHYDHLDYPTVRELRRWPVPFVTSLGVGAHLAAWGIPPARIVELDWWESHDLGPVSITAAPAQHFSGRTFGSRNSTLWSSLVIRSARHAVFFSGDTGLSGEYRQIRARLGPFDLAMLEVGGFHPSWGDMHLGPRNALAPLQLLDSPPFLPVHWGTFSLSTHAWDQPPEVLFAAAAAASTPMLMPRLGEAVEPAHAVRPLPWWRGVEQLRQRIAPAAAQTPPTLPPAMGWPPD